MSSVTRTSLTGLSVTGNGAGRRAVVANHHAGSIIAITYALFARAVDGFGEVTLLARNADWNSERRLG
jgi:hypothetical protein